MSSEDLESAWEFGARAQFSKPASVVRTDVPLGSVAVQFIPVGEVVEILIADNDGLGTLRSPASRASIDRWGRAAFEALAQPGGQASDALKELYSALVSPFQERLSRAKRIVLIPAPEFESIPFSALQQLNGSYLVESHEIEVTRGLTDAPGQVLCGQTLVATRSEFAPPLTNLPAAESEGRKIEGLFPSVTGLHGVDGSASEIARLLQIVSVAHFGTHAVSYQHNPSASAFLFQPDEQHPSGLLYGREIAELELQCNLVTLSACETSDQGQSLAQAFLHAGARRVVASAWRAHDEAAGLWMGSFYDEIASRAAPAAAHRAACLALIQSSFRNPHYWAPWKLLG